MWLYILHTSVSSDTKGGGFHKRPKVDSVTYFVDRL